MSSIVFDGHDFSAFTTCAVDESAHAIVPTAKVIPGRAGSLLLNSRIPPRVLRVKLFLDPRYDPGVGGLSDLRHKIYSWLAATGGAVLEVPGDPSLEWHHVICTGGGEWTTLEENASCELEFTCFDPIAYGDARTEAGDEFEVGGTWPTWPAFSIVAAAGNAVQVACGETFVRVEHAFSGGETVAIDCENEAVNIDGVDARADVTLASDFFRLDPGDVELTFAGCASHAVAFRERWI